jgi:hypothetical protein
LSVPDDVQVWNENLMGNFLQFTYNIWTINLIQMPQTLKC